MGRYKRHPVEETRTKVWFAETSRAYGDKTAYWFWKNYGKKIGSLTTWNNYKAGVHNPKYLDGHGAVPTLGKHRPRTANIYNALFWQVLKRDWPSEKELINEFSNLGGAFSILPKIILDGGFQDNKDPDGSIPLDNMFGQLTRVADGDFYLLQAVVLMFSWAKDAHSKYWDMCCDLYREILPKLILEMDTPFKSEIFDHVDNLAGKIDASYMNKTGFIYKNWRDEIPRYKDLLSDYYFEGICSQRKFVQLPEGIFSNDFIKKISSDLAEEIVKDEALLLDSQKFGPGIAWALGKAYQLALSAETKQKDKFNSVLSEELEWLFYHESKGETREDDFHFTFTG